MQVVKMVKKRANPIFGKNIVRLRKSKGFRSGKAFAEALKMPYPTIRDIEGGISGGNQETRNVIAEFLGVTEAELLMDPAKPVSNQIENKLFIPSINEIAEAVVAKIEAAKPPPVSILDTSPKGKLIKYIESLSDDEAAYIQDKAKGLIEARRSIRGQTTSKSRSKKI